MHDIQPTIRETEPTCSGLPATLHDGPHGAHTRDHDGDLPTLADPESPTMPRDRKRPRSSDEVRREREAQRQETDRALDRLVAEFHAQLPRDRATQSGAAYARFSTRFQHSILDQVRSLMEAAVRMGVFIPRDQIFYDLAVSGTRARRQGLLALDASLAGRAVQVLLVFATNRLFRKTYKALQFVEEKVVGRGIRCVFVKSGVDSHDERRWRLLMNFHAMTDELAVTMYGDHIRAAHEGLFLNGMVCTTLPFGYRGRPIAGQSTKQHKPRRTIEIDPETAPWVEKVFRWYVEERLPISRIVHRLNGDENAPVGLGSTSGRWRHVPVRNLLTNPCYRGSWRYGKTRSVLVPEKDYIRQFPRDQPLREEQREHLRIVDDTLWFGAQRRLAEEPRGSGRNRARGERRTHPTLLNGFFVCPEHDRILYVGGAHGRNMFCTTCRGLPRAQRPLYSELNRARALEQTCTALAGRIRRDPELVELVIAACQRAAADVQKPDPEALRRLAHERDALTARIELVFDNPGETDTDRREAEDRLRRLRRNRAAVEAEIVVLEARHAQTARVPTETEVRALLDRVEGILVAAAHHGSEEETAQAREVIRMLTGGRIELFQQGERRSQRGWLQGRVRVRLVPGLVESLTGLAPTAAPEDAELRIDYRAPTLAEQCSEPVKTLLDQGLLIKEIASRLGIPRNLAAKALDHWYESRGLEKPDGRSRRAGLDRKNLEDPKYVAIADQVMRFWDEGLLLQDIATRLGSNRNMVTQAVAYWHESRGLPVPDGRTRRKSLERSSATPRPVLGARPDFSNPASNLPAAT
jgi:DNA invertase Pin-like site-specific DNA recombinase